MLIVVVLLVTVAGCSTTTNIQVTKHRIKWQTEQSIRVVQLTDLHIGWGAKKSLISEIAKRVKQVKPDLTVLTGDYINHLYHLEELRQFLRDLPRPCLATLGNHDHKADAAKITAVFKEEGVRVLSNETTRLELRGNELFVVGIDDNITRHHDVDKALKDLPPAKRALVLSHAPSIAKQVVARSKAEHLILVGHTHAGQIQVPIVSPLVARARGVRYLVGWYRVKNSRMYVNAGVGNATIRKRVGNKARPEIAVFELVR